MSMTWSPKVAMSKKEIEAFLAEKNIARVATNRPDGYPHITPLWYSWDGKFLYLVLGAGERPRQHIKNLRRDPKITVIIDKDIRPQVGDLKPGAQAVLIRGKAKLLRDEKSQYEATRTILRRYFGPSADVFIDMAVQDGKPGKNRVVVKIKPEKMLSWDFVKLGA